MNKLDKQYQDLLQDILNNGVEKKDRTGTGTLSLFGKQIRHKMSEGFPLLTTKKMAWNVMVTELLWFLRGDTNIKFLLDYDCHIWDGDTYKNYTKDVNDLIEGYMCGDIIGMQSHIEDMFSNPDDLTPLTQEEFIDKIKSNDEFAKKWGELGPIYGKQWRKWGGLQDISDDDEPIYLDQIQNLIDELKTNPDSRRMMVSAWNPSDLPSMVLPPCHYGFQVYTRKLTGEEMWDLLKKKVGEKRFNLMVDDIVPFGGGLSEELQSYNIPKRSISLMFNMRSTDVGLGLSFNLASYGLLLAIIAKQVNMIPDELIYNGGDVHLYLNHIEPIKEQLNREPYSLPTVKISDKVVNDISEYTFNDFILSDYQSHPTIKMTLSN